MKYGSDYFCIISNKGVIKAASNQYKECVRYVTIMSEYSKPYMGVLYLRTSKGIDVSTLAIVSVEFLSPATIEKNLLAGA